MVRLFIFWIKSFFLKQSLDANDVSTCNFRVMPWDCDPNMHMTNSRYFTYMDYGRFWRLFQLGIFRQMIFKNRWMQMAVSQEITYIRDIEPFEKFEIRTQLAGWDEKYLYVVQDFYGKKGLCAKAMVRGLYVHNKKPVPLESILALLGNPPMPVKFQERILTLKKIQELKKAEHTLKSDS
jgi:acyl-CoA thioesterase FadM